jgi:hypothetical protein
MSTVICKCFSMTILYKLQMKSYFLFYRCRRLMLECLFFFCIFKEKKIFLTCVLYLYTMYNILLYTLRVATYIFNLNCFKICIYFIFVFPSSYTHVILVILSLTNDDKFRYSEKCYYYTYCVMI